MRHFIPVLAAVILFGLNPAHADEAKPYADNKNVDLTLILPPPPANDSAETRKELGEVLAIQMERTPDMTARAKADDEEDVWRFEDVIGPKLSKDGLPHFAAFFDRIAATEGAVVDPAKKVFNRPRPYQLSELVKPAIDPSKSAAWPSGHATLGTLMEILLADMIPEKRSQIMTRAWEYGRNRVVAGMHYPSDVEMGRISGSVIASYLMQDNEFKSEYETARKEVRTALGL